MTDDLLAERGDRPGPAAGIGAPSAVKRHALLDALADTRPSQPWRRSRARGSDGVRIWDRARRMRRRRQRECRGPAGQLLAAWGDDAVLAARADAGDR